MNNILKNTAFLFLVQISGYVIPLIELPFLARVLSPNILGQIIFIQVVALTTSFFVEYGFNLKAARDFAQCNDNFAKRSELIATIFQAKLILFAIVAAIFFGCYFSLEVMSEKIPSDFLVPLFLSMIGFGFSSFWYFQATEKMGWAALWEFTTRLSYLISILLFIKDDSDAINILYFQSFFIVLSTFGEFIWLFLHEKITLVKWQIAWCEIKQGGYAFIYKSSSSILSTMSVWILGLVSSSTAVAYYVGADKIIKAAVGLSQPVILASYPYFSRLAMSNKQQSYSLVVKYCLYAILVIVPFLLITCFFSPYIIKFFLGEKYLPSIDVLQVLLLVIPLRVLSTIIGHLGLLAQHKDKVISNITLMVSLIGICLCFTGGYNYQQIGMAIAVVVIELMMFILYLGVFLRGKINQ